jgi:hypothetical protein
MQTDGHPNSFSACGKLQDSSGHSETSWYMAAQSRKQSPLKSIFFMVKLLIITTNTMKIQLISYLAMNTCSLSVPWKIILIRPSTSTQNTTSDSDSSYTPSTTQSMPSNFSCTESTQLLTDWDTSSSHEGFSIDLSSYNSDTSTVVLNQVLQHTSDPSNNSFSSSSHVLLSTSPSSLYSQTGS